MATFEILNQNADYIFIAVEFLDQRFEQLIISSLSGSELTVFLQAYADQYEYDWINATQIN